MDNYIVYKLTENDEIDYSDIFIIPYYEIPDDQYDENEQVSEDFIFEKANERWGKDWQKLGYSQWNPYQCDECNNQSNQLH